jgi:hypothetical protein
VHGGDGATSVNTAGAHASANSLLDQTHTDVDQHFEQDDHTRIDNHGESGSHDHVDAHNSHDVNIHP